MDRIKAKKIGTKAVSYSWGLTPIEGFKMYVYT